MNVKKFSDVMGEIDIKYVDEAFNYKKKVKRAGWIKWGAMAAGLCLLAVIVIIASSLLRSQESDGDNEQLFSAQDVIAEPGFLMLTVYAASPDENVTAELPADEEVIMEEGMEVHLNYNWNLAMSSRPGIPLTLSAPEYPYSIFEVSVDGGELLLWETEIVHLGSSYSAENNTTVYWTSMTPTGDGDFELYRGSDIYINIVIREENNIVGYAVVEIYSDGLEDDPSQIYCAKLLRSVSFPKVNGEYQEVTAEYVASEMEQVKNGKR